MQPASDDASHDETLSSRVAALNMLDLGLEHLDIHVENVGPELDLVVTACGDSKSITPACQFYIYPTPQCCPSWILVEARETRPLCLLQPIKLS